MINNDENKTTREEIIHFLLFLSFSQMFVFLLVFYKLKCRKIVLLGCVTHSFTIAFDNRCSRVVKQKVLYSKQGINSLGQSTKRLVYILANFCPYLVKYGERKTSMTRKFGKSNGNFKEKTQLMDQIFIKRLLG